MKSEALIKSFSLEWTLFAFGLFIVLFIGIVLKTYSRSMKNHYNKMENLPLEEGASYEQ